MCDLINEQSIFFIQISSGRVNLGLLLDSKTQGTKRTTNVNPKFNELYATWSNPIDNIFIRYSLYIKLSDNYSKHAGVRRGGVDLAPHELCLFLATYSASKNCLCSRF